MAPVRSMNPHFRFSSMTAASPSEKSSASRKLGLITTDPVLSINPQRGRTLLVHSYTRARPSENSSTKSKRGFTFYTCSTEKARNNNERENARECAPVGSFWAEHCSSRRPNRSSKISNVIDTCRLFRVELKQLLFWI